MLRRGSVAQSVEQRPFKALVPGSSPGRPSPSETTIYLRKLELSERATRGTKTHEITFYSSSAQKTQRAQGCGYCAAFRRLIEIISRPSGLVHLRVCHGTKERNTDTAA
jgi:hypothetical protein